MKTKIIIEISGGTVSATYFDGKLPADITVQVFDTDCWKVGEGNPVSGVALEPVDNASDYILDQIRP